MSVRKIFILLVSNRECMERNVVTSFRILSSFECFLLYVQTEWSSFFTFQCELFTSCNVSNNASLVSERTGGGGGQTKVDSPGQGEGVPKILKFVWTSFMDDPNCNTFSFWMTLEIWYCIISLRKLDKLLCFVHFCGMENKIKYWLTNFWYFRYSLDLFFLRQEDLHLECDFSVIVR